MTREKVGWIWGSLGMGKLSRIRQFSFVKAILSEGIIGESFLLPAEI